MYQVGKNLNISLKPGRRDLNTAEETDLPADRAGAAERLVNDGLFPLGLWDLSGRSAPVVHNSALRTDPPAYTAVHAPLLIDLMALFQGACNCLYRTAFGAEGAADAGICNMVGHSTASFLCLGKRDRFSLA